jgi:class 3 adenylate cyclase
VDKETFVADLALAPCRILIAETTLYHLGDLFSVERIGDVVLKGKAETLTVYSVVSGQARVPSAVPGKEELA